MKSCKTCVFASDYEFSPACKKCFHHSNWQEKTKTESPPMTNADYIRSMSDEELSVYLALVENLKKPGPVFMDTSDKWLEWLKQPYKEKEE